MGLKYLYISWQLSLDITWTSVAIIYTMWRKGSSDAYNTGRESHGDRKTQQEEMITGKRTLQNNNDSANIISSSAGRNRRVKEENQNITTVCLIRVNSISEKIPRISYSYNMTTIFKSSATLRRHISRWKPNTGRIWLRNAWTLFLVDVVKNIKVK